MRKRIGFRCSSVSTEPKMGSTCDNTQTQGEMKISGGGDSKLETKCRFYSSGGPTSDTRLIDRG